MGGNILILLLWTWMAQDIPSLSQQFIINCSPLVLLHIRSFRHFLVMNILWVEKSNLVFVNVSKKNLFLSWIGKPLVILNYAVPFFWALPICLFSIANFLHAWFFFKGWLAWRRENPSIRKGYHCCWCVQFQKWNSWDQVMQGSSLLFVSEFIQGFVVGKFHVVNLERCFLLQLGLPLKLTDPNTVALHYNCVQWGLGGLWKCQGISRADTIIFIFVLPSLSARVPLGIWSIYHLSVLKF